MPARPSPDPEHWTLWGAPNCGKGQPEQVMGTGHGASPARFTQHQDRERLCRLNAAALPSHFRPGRRTPRARSESPMSRPSSRPDRARSRASPTTPSIRTWPSAACIFPCACRSTDAPRAPPPIVSIDASIRQVVEEAVALTSLQRARPRPAAAKWDRPPACPRCQSLARSHRRTSRPTDRAASRRRSHPHRGSRRPDRRRHLLHRRQPSSPC